jgi:hypothetical protein
MVLRRGLVEMGRLENAKKSEVSEAIAELGKRCLIV